MTAIFSNHALLQMERRSIDKELVIEIINAPDEITKQDTEVWVFAKVVNEGPKAYLYRVFMNVTKQPNLIITAYKTSKFDKYGYSV